MTNRKVGKFTLIDANNRTTTRSYEVNGGIGDVIAQSALLLACTDLGLDSAGLVETNNTPVVGAVVGSSTSESALLNIVITNPNGVDKPYRLIITAPKEAIFDGNAVDITNVAVIAYCDQFAIGGNLRLAGGSVFKTLVSGRRM